MINKKQNRVFSVFLIVILAIQVSCTPKTPSDLSKESIIPKPVSMTATGELFALKSGTDVYIGGESKELRQIGQYLADKLKLSTGFGIEVLTTNKTPRSGNIYLTIAENNSIPNLGDEGYELTITKKLVLLSANNPAGLFRGVQTIRQLLPAKIELSSQTGPWEIATGTITDYPVYT